MSTSFAKVLDRHALRRLAGERFFERGEDYFSAGAVHDLAEHAGTIVAKVRGTGDYKVEFSLKDGALDHSCSCPVGIDGAFCKHCVAVGLEWLNSGKRDAGVAKGARSPALSMEDVRACLDAEPKEALVRMLMERAMDDDLLRRRLLLHAAKQGRGRIDLATFRNAIDAAVDCQAIEDYRDMHDYAQGIDEVVDSIEELRKDGHASEAIELVEHALRAVEEAMQSVDDSDGEMGSLLERLQEIHLVSCLKAPPDPVDLAKRLFAWEMSTPWDTFYGAAEKYASLLGEKGLAVYRELAEAQWARVPARGPDQSKGGYEYFRVTHVMETLARQSGDVEAVVAVKSRDLSSAYAYLQIAETYQQARNPGLALEWAEKGVKAFPKQTDSRLRDFLAEEYHRRQRHDEAMALIWSEFLDQPGLTGFQQLKAHADRSKQWPVWRNKALAFLRELIAKEKAVAGKSPPRWFARVDHSKLVEISLWERDVESAWQEAKSGGCSNGLWLKLAALRESKHPDEALPVYQAQVEPVLDLKHNEAYRQAVVFLRKIRDLMGRVGRGAEFSRYLDSVRATHKPKRNFIKMLDQAKLS